MKKKRGLKRYFRTLNVRNAKIPDVWLKDGYFSYDKIWVDYVGFSGIKKRKPHLEFLFRNYEELMRQAASINLPCQMWIWINECSSKDDCIFLHSPNPFSEYPHKYRDLSIENNFKNTEMNLFIESKVEYKKRFGTQVRENPNGKKCLENFCILFKSDSMDSILESD